jgi:hypothetical protein
MKKLVLAATLLSVVTLSSCKSEKEKVVDNVTEAQTTIQETADKAVESSQESAQDLAKALPTFASTQAAAFAQKYSDYASQLKAVAASGDQAKLNELTAKAVEYEKELQQIQSTLTAEDAKKLTDFVNDIKKSVQ